MISISSKTYDINGNEYFNKIASNTNFGNLTRRVNRTKTLDGSSVINDKGYTDADRTFDVYITDPSEDVVDNIRRMFKAYPLMIVATREGVFEVAPNALDDDRDELHIQFLVNQLLSR